MRISKNALNKIAHTTAFVTAVGTIDLKESDSENVITMNHLVCEHADGHQWIGISDCWDPNKTIYHPQEMDIAVLIDGATFIVVEITNSYIDIIPLNPDIVLLHPDIIPNIIPNEVNIVPQAANIVPNDIYPWLFFNQNQLSHKLEMPDEFLESFKTLQDRLMPLC